MALAGGRAYCGQYRRDKVNDLTYGLQASLDTFNVIPDLASPREVEESLRQILGDPTLEVFWWDPERRRYIDVADRPVSVDKATGRASTKVEYESRKIGLIRHDLRLLEMPGFLDVFIPTMRIAMERDRLHRDLNAKIEQLRASRIRMLEAAVTERRKLERNLHDGAQQRLVALSLTLRLAQSRLATEPKGAADLIAGACAELDLALVELRELARGIHPAVLTDLGLRAALEALVARTPIHVELATVDEHLAPPIEAAVYYIVAEGLTNAVKHSRASQIWVRVARAGMLTVEVRDDGVGGACAARSPESTGLHGLRCRVETLDGRLEIESPVGGGTQIVALLPLEA
jgi:signal transduction histidine kinase